MIKTLIDLKFNTIKREVAVDYYTAAAEKRVAAVRNAAENIKNLNRKELA